MNHVHDQTGQALHSLGALARFELFADEALALTSRQHAFDLVCIPIA
jgi:hypothetical protein